MCIIRYFASVINLNKQRSNETLVGAVIQTSDLQDRRRACHQLSHAVKFILYPSFCGLQSKINVWVINISTLGNHLIKLLFFFKKVQFLYHTSEYQHFTLILSFAWLPVTKENMGHNYGYPKESPWAKLLQASFELVIMILRDIN
jgi:hypothetical protein